MSHPPHPPWCNHPNNIRWIIQDEVHHCTIFSNLSLCFQIFIISYLQGNRSRPTLRTKRHRTLNAWEKL
jgi:hypothetical protein